MTHTLHREGNKQDLRNDYILLGMTEPGVNTKGAKKKFERLLEIFSKYNPTNLGVLSPRTKHPINTLRGDSIKDIESAFDDFSVLHVVYSDRKKLASALKALKAEDLGISVVASGLFEEISDLLSGNKTAPFFHTLNISLGILGNTNQLPSADNLKIITMCGHGMISNNLVDHRFAKIRSGELTSEQAASEIGKHCVCGIFNKERAKCLIEKCLKREKY